MQRLGLPNRGVHQLGDQLRQRRIGEVEDEEGVAVPGHGKIQVADHAPADLGEHRIKHLVDQAWPRQIPHILDGEAVAAAEERARQNVIASQQHAGRTVVLLRHRHRAS